MWIISGMQYESVRRRYSFFASRVPYILLLSLRMELSMANEQPAANKITLDITNNNNQAFIERLFL